MSPRPTFCSAVMLIPRIALWRLPLFIRHFHFPCGLELLSFTNIPCSYLTIWEFGDMVFLCLNAQCEEVENGQVND
jgi:hypothetical protein